MGAKIQYKDIPFGSTVCGCKRLEITPSPINRDWLNQLGPFALWEIHSPRGGQSLWDVDDSPEGLSEKSKVSVWVFFFLSRTQSETCAVLTFVGERGISSCELVHRNYPGQGPPSLVAVMVSEEADAGGQRPGVRGTLTVHRSSCCLNLCGSY